MFSWLEWLSWLLVAHTTARVRPAVVRQQLPRPPNRRARWCVPRVAMATSNAWVVNFYITMYESVLSTNIGKVVQCVTSMANASQNCWRHKSVVSVWILAACFSFKLRIFNCTDNGLSPRQYKAIIWTSSGKLLIWPINKNLNEIQIFHSRNCLWKCRLRNDVHFVSASMWYKWGYLSYTFPNRVFSITTENIVNYNRGQRFPANWYLRCNVCFVFNLVLSDVKRKWRKRKKQWLPPDDAKWV